eukprot:bmy_21914T0
MTTVAVVVNELVPHRCGPESLEPLVTLTAVTSGRGLRLTLIPLCKDALFLDKLDIINGCRLTLGARRGPGDRARGYKHRRPRGGDTFCETGVVSGMNYFLEVEVGRTTCTKSQANLDNCPFHDQPHLKKQKLCTFQVYVVPWMNVMSLEKFSCQDE